MHDIGDKRQQWLHDGYVILHDVVPAQQLETLRKSVDAAVAAHRRADPAWDTPAAPRAQIASNVDGDSIDALEFVLHDNTLGTSCRLIDCDAEQAAAVTAGVLCNPEFEPADPDRPGQAWGTDPRNWHRDIRPDRDGPLGAMIADEHANGPAYAQWNIALYEDDILYVVPGSHRRLNEPAEASHLAHDRGTLTPMAGSVRVNLKPGDGVVYNSLMLHWGSRYSNQHKRRTIHLGYRSFGRILPRQRQCSLPMNICDLFAEDTPQRRVFERWLALYQSEFAMIAEIFRAVIDADADRFHAGLARLHPDPKGRLTCLILLSKYAVEMHQPIAKTEPQPVFTAMQQQLASQFTAEQAQRLWQRFEVFDQMLRTGEVSYVAGFLGPTTDYAFEKVPDGLTADRVCQTLLATASSG